MWTDVFTPLRWLIRGSLFFLHATVILVPCLLLLAFGSGVRIGGRSLDVWALNFWSLWTCRLFGLWPTVRGELADGPLLVVANHVSWADIQALHSVAPMSFVAKAEIGEWPLFGFLASRGGTIYHKRGSHDSSAGVMAQVHEKLDSGGRVAVFPEGGIFPGEEIKHFHARMFKVAQDSGCPVQPTMIRYTRNGQRDAETTFLEGENFMVNLARLMGRPGCRAEIAFLEPFPSGDLPRKALAARAEAAVREAYDAPVDP